MSSESQKRKRIFMRSVIRYSYPHHEGIVMQRLYVTRTARRLMLIVAVLNLTGIACLSGAASIAGARTPIAPRASVTDVASLLDSIGFTLMLPGVFFATIVFLCGRTFGWNDQTVCVVWYACAMVINLVIAWRISAAVDGADRTDSALR